MSISNPHLRTFSQSEDIKEAVKAFLIEQVKLDLEMFDTSKDDVQAGQEIKATARALQLIKKAFDEIDTLDPKPVSKPINQAR